MYVNKLLVKTVQAQNAFPKDTSVEFLIYTSSKKYFSESSSYLLILYGFFLLRLRQCILAVSRWTHLGCYHGGTKRTVPKRHGRQQSHVCSQCRLRVEVPILMAQGHFQTVCPFFTFTGLSKQLQWQPQSTPSVRFELSRVSFLAWTDPGKFTLGASQDCHPDVTIWMDLASVGRDFCEAGPNHL